MDVTLASGIFHGQSLWLVALAGPLCLTGGWATSRFFRRMMEVHGTLRHAWLFLTSLVSGVPVWCTHFVAMLGYQPARDTTFGWQCTALSLLIALAGSALAFQIASGPARSRLLPGGAGLPLRPPGAAGGARPGP